MDTFIIKAAQLILALAILVIIHEFGHFLFARIFGIRVNKFYIFFNPWKSLVKWRPGKYFGVMGKRRHFDPKMEAEYKELCEKLANTTKDEEKYSLESEFEEKYYYNEVRPAEENGQENGKKKKHFWKDTEYGVGWLPLGGYCQIAGMIDESMDTEQMKREPQEWEFRSKPAWQRLLVMAAGVLFNFLLAILIYAGIVYATGEKYVPFTEAKMGMTWSPVAKSIGFQEGDIPLEADGKPLDNPNEALMEIAQASKVTVLRNGKDTAYVNIPDKLMFRIDEEVKSGQTMIPFMAYRFPARVNRTVSGEPAAKGGIEAGDEIVAVNGRPTATLYDFLQTLQGHENEKVEVAIIRNGAATDTLRRSVTLNGASKMGIELVIDPSEFYNSKEIHYNIFQSIPRGITMGTDKLVAYAKSMKLVFTKEGAQSIGGFGALGSIFPSSWNWIAFWNVAAFLSVALAFMNILPIPALDGGHILFLLYEVVFRRKPSQKFMEYAQMVGMGLLILLLIYANGMDIVRLFK